MALMYKEGSLRYESYYTVGWVDDSAFTGKRGYDTAEGLMTAH